MFSDQQDRHAQMARLDPRDTNGDGVVSPEEAAAYIRDYLDSASPEERSQIMKDYFGGMSPDQRQQMGTALGQSPVNAGRPLNADNDDDLVNAYTRTAQAPRRTAAARWKPRSVRAACSTARSSRRASWASRESSAAACCAAEDCAPSPPAPERDAGGFLRKGLVFGKGAGESR